jgi:Skp family chaperone for outer membrane proteins
MIDMNLTSDEKKLANDLKVRFAEVRSEIRSIEEEMESLTHKAGTLVRDLEHLRDEEKRFIQDLQQKYGEGKLDPYKLVYTT